MKTVVYPGSFDPITKGHLDIILRASKLFDKLIVVVLINADKVCSFSIEERKEMIRACTAGLDNVEVDSYGGLLVEYVKSANASAVVKGLRAVSDFEYEFQMALTNKVLSPSFETLYMNTDAKHMYLSSSIVKQIASYGGDISPFVPPEVLCSIESRLKGNKKC